MFRFLHTADLHLDSPLRGLASREDAGAEILINASRRACEALVQLAISEEVDFVLIAGDIYDGDWKDFGTGLFFRREMARLSATNIPVYLISGNHDAASVITRKLTLPEGVHSFPIQSPSTEELAELPVAIHGMSFPKRAVEENLVPRYPDPIPEKFNIGLLHTSLAGSEGHDTYAPCSLDDLRNKGYDYWALGHIHQPQIVNENPWIVFPGNIQGRHIREAGPRGCRIVSVDGSLRVTNCEWHSLDVARWAEVRVDAGGVNDKKDLLPEIQSAITRAMDEAEGRLLAMRLIITGTTAIHGDLVSNSAWLRAQVQSITEDFGAEAVWLEKVKIVTRPLISLEEMAQTSALTRLVIEAKADGAEEGHLPESVKTMLAALTNELQASLQDAWTEEMITGFYDDARTLILDRLVGKGGDA